MIGIYVCLLARLLFVCGGVPDPSGTNLGLVQLSAGGSAEKKVLCRDSEWAEGLQFPICEVLFQDLPSSAQHHTWPGVSIRKVLRKVYGFEFWGLLSTHTFVRQPLLSIVFMGLIGKSKP